MAGCTSLDFLSFFPFPPVVVLMRIGVLYFTKDAYDSEDSKNTNNLSHLRTPIPLAIRKLAAACRAHYKGGRLIVTVTVHSALRS